MKKKYIIPITVNESVRMFGDLLADPNLRGGSYGTNFVDANEGSGDFEVGDDQDFVSPKTSLWDE